MASELVYIIIPAYNRGQYLDQCIRSALTQTHQEVEVLVVDDGSSDNTSEVLASWTSDPRLRVLTHEGRRNRGQSASINLALRQCQGQYINILDSDDFIAPEKLDIQLELFRSHPEFGLVYSNGYLTDADGSPIHSYHAPDHEDPGSPDAALLDCYMALPVNALVRREVYERVGEFEESFRAAQDHDMLIRMAEVTKFGYTPQHLFYYRRHGNSISATRQDVRWRAGFEILKRAKARYPYKRATIRKRLAVLHFRMAQVYWRNGHQFRASGRAALAGMLDPLRALSVLLGREPAR